MAIAVAVAVRSTLERPLSSKHYYFGNYDISEDTFKKWLETPRVLGISRFYCYSRQGVDVALLYFRLENLL